MSNRRFEILKVNKNLCYKTLIIYASTMRTCIESDDMHIIRLCGKIYKKHTSTIH